MAYYRVELGYKTKRGGVALGMTVKAFGPDEAEELVRNKYLDPYPARQWCYTNITEADEHDMAMGVANP